MTFASPVDKLLTTIHNRGAARAAVTRKDFTDRLGLPENATNDEVLAAVPARSTRTASPAPADPAEALAKLAWGTEASRPATDLTGLSAAEAAAFAAAGWAA